MKSERRRRLVGGWCPVPTAIFPAGPVDNHCLQRLRSCILVAPGCLNSLSSHSHSQVRLLCCSRGCGGPGPTGYLSSGRGVRRGCNGSPLGIALSTPGRDLGCRRMRWIAPVLSAKKRVRRTPWPTPVCCIHSLVASAPLARPSISASSTSVQPLSAICSRKIASHS